MRLDYPQEFPADVEMRYFLVQERKHCARVGVKHHRLVSANMFAMGCSFFRTEEEQAALYLSVSLQRTR